MTIEGIINAAEEAYVSVMGREKWDGLSSQEKHDVVMALCTGLLKALD